jgi:hypothetical protein
MIDRKIKRLKVLVTYIPFGCEKLKVRGIIERERE